jgi:hypothetical protein
MPTAASSPYTLWTLLDHRERWEALKADPSTMTTDWRRSRFAI